jgi:hypothetical protein
MQMRNKNLKQNLQMHTKTWNFENELLAISEDFLCGETRDYGIMVGSEEGPATYMKQ